MTAARSLVRRLRDLDGQVLILSGISFVSGLGIAVVLPLLPLYAVSLGATALQVGMLTSAFAVASAIGQLGTGLLANRVGVHRLMVSGMSVYAAANVLIAVAVSAPSLIAWRALAGVGAGASVIAARLYVASTAPPARLAFTNGMLSAAAAAGMVRCYPRPPSCCCSRSSCFWPPTAVSSQHTRLLRNRSCSGQRSRWG